MPTLRLGADILILIAFRTPVHSNVGALWLLVIAGTGLFAAFGPWWAWTMTFVPRNQSGSALGFINVAGNFGGIRDPIFIGLAAGRGGEISGFYIPGIALIISCVLLTAVAPKLYIKTAEESGMEMIK